MYYGTTTATLFDGEELRVHLLGQIASARSACEALRDEDVLGRRAEAITMLRSRYAIEPVNLRDAEKKVHPPKETSERLGDGSFRRGMRITVDLPYGGDSNLFFMVPSQFKMSTRPYATVKPGTVTVSRTFDGVPTQEQVLGWYREELETIRFYLQAANSDVAAYNRDLEQLLPQLVDARIKRLEEMRRFNDSFNLDAG